MDVEDVVIVMPAVLTLMTELLGETNSSGFMVTEYCRQQAQNRLKKNILQLDIKRKVPKIKNYVSIINILPTDIFHSHFRMSRTTFEILMTKVGPRLLKCNKAGLESVDPQTCLLLTLWTLSNQCCFRDVADRFGIARGGAHGIYIETCKIICEFTDEYIKWPRTHAELNGKVLKFNKLRGMSSFPGVVGALDGMHLAIPAPTVDPQSYFNRKSFHSLNLQAICDSEMRFLDIFFGWPGSSHDASVWKQSPIGEALNNRQLNLPDRVHIVGDSAYPLKSFLMRPYKDNGHLTRKQKKFNIRLSSTRVVIEQAFGRLRGKFRRLKFINMSSLTLVQYVVFAACILHNFIIDNPDADNDFDSDYYSSDSSDSDVNESDDENYIRGRDVQGKIKRDSIADML